MKKLLLGLVALVVVAGIGLWQFSGSAKAAPQATFTSLDGRQFTTQDLRGKVVLVKFWATSCVTCVQQMPDTIEAYNEYAPQGYEVVAVAMDYDPPDYVRNFTQSRQLPFTVAMDTSGEIAKAFGDVKLTPTAFLVDKQGRIIKRYLGNYDKTAFRQTVERALAG
ncbi:MULTISPECIES: TlpA disulfide reductase family protein [Pusillimonas]|uniref:TlpA disulfide reductase family protein n=1 Tax=Pusillimonas TaxID=305976 RepID=UPI000E59E625|nr:MULTISPECIES: TlpA disulfide reductase family protein [Pusillimonas]MDX3894726.1 TlpA disulfide reductase family protein [Pusillimonas sp.]TFL15521.1 TlpA family protein disulfide reductase [Pusillimonas caeni]